MSSDRRSMSTSELTDEDGRRVAATFVGWGEVTESGTYAPGLVEKFVAGIFWQAV